MPAKEGNERLDSWKEIADYLKRDVGTVIRWEKERGLPVHRAPGGKRKVIFAYRREIDGWLSSTKNERTLGKQSSFGENDIRSQDVCPPPTASSVASVPLERPESSDCPISGIESDSPFAIAGHISEIPESSGDLPTPRQSNPSRNKWLYLALAVSILGTLGMATRLVLERKLPKFYANRIAAEMPTPSLSQYDFEDGEQGWIVRPKMMISKVFSSDTHHWQGNRSLAIIFDGPYARKSQIYVNNPPIAAGRSVTAHVWCPAKNQLESVALFIEDGENTWSNDWKAFTTLIPGSWNKLVVRIPSDAITPLSRLGLEFTAFAPWKGTCYVDTIDW